MIFMSERALYKPVEDMFANKGYLSISSRKKFAHERVHGAFGVDVHGSIKEIDVVAFKWADGEIEAKAVECKAGKTWEDVGAALGQATAYQRLISDVYVATQTAEKDLRHTESILRELGLGYISVENGKAEEIFHPSHNIRFNQKEFELQVKRKAMALLGFQEILGRGNFQFGQVDQPRDIWVSSLEPCNMMCSPRPKEERTFWFALDIESKPAVRSIFSTVEPKRIHKLLSELPLGYELCLWKLRRYYPKKEYEKDEVEKEVSKLGVDDISIYVDMIKKWDWKAHLQIGKEVTFNILSKTLFVSEFKKAVRELANLKSYLNGLA